MDEKKNVNPDEIKEKTSENEQELSPTWAQDNIQDLEDFIESQGIYLRQ